MAKRFSSTKSFNVFELDLEYWDYPPHSHNFFELIFIISGNGKHLINTNEFEYKAGDVFLLTPKDEHKFIVNKRTVFGYIKFTEQLFLEKTELVSGFSWRKQIDVIILHSNGIPGSVIHNESDRESAFQLFKLLKKEFNSVTTYSRLVLLELFGALLIIISRNISSNCMTSVFSEEDKVYDILTYIRQNVLENHKMKISHIAKTFFISPNYVSIFIKKHAGISIQQYVIQTKIKMAERLLKQSNLSISEIAGKLNFTDVSHFTKIFKKYIGKTPREYRRKDIHL